MQSQHIFLEKEGSDKKSPASQKLQKYVMAYFKGTKLEIFLNFTISY